MRVRGLEAVPWRLAAVVSLVSGALIVLQVSFTRLAAYVLYYHFVFFAISLALLGLGAAGSLVAVRPPVADLNRNLRGWLAAFTLSLPIGFLLLAHPPVANHEPGMKLLGRDALAYLLWSAPIMVWLNFCGGLVLSRVFARWRERIGALYACDLVGAGLGCLLALAWMRWLTPPGAFLLASLPVAAAGLALGAPADARARRTTATVIGLGLALAISVLLGPASLRDFSAFRGTAMAEPEDSEWNHLIRTDRIGRRYILDGDAVTPIVEWSEAERSRPVSDPGYFLAVPRPAVAIIGFGGGPEVAEALRAEAASILAIDINPTLASWARGQHAGMNQGLFLDPRIDLRVGEGRHTLRASGRRFDLLVMHAIDTYTATASGAYALSENFLYTREAIGDYWRALGPDGVASISRWLFNPPRENLRLLATAIEALRAEGVTEPERHLAMLAPVGDFEEVRGKRVWGYLLMSRQPLDPARLARLDAQVASAGWCYLYAPGRRYPTPFDAYVHAADRAAFRADYPYNIAPVSDASPYLFQFYKLFGASSYRREGDWLVLNIYQSSLPTLLGALAVSLVASLLLILAPLWWSGRRRAAGGPPAARLGIRQVVYFAALGIGFMAVEVPLIQILSLYLGHPTYGFSIALVALLVSTGFGSLLADRLRPGRALACLVVAAEVTALNLLALPLVHRTIDWPDPARFAVAIALAGACGLGLGFPFALGVRALAAGERLVSWAWAVNGTSSVVGSVLVMLLMVSTGTHAALGVCAALYLLAALAGRAGPAAG